MVVCIYLRIEGYFEKYEILEGFMKNSVIHMICYKSLNSKGQAKSMYLEKL